PRAARLPPPPPPPPEVAPPAPPVALAEGEAQGLIALLDSPDPQARGAATERLAGAGLEVLPLLERAAVEGSPETRWRAREAAGEVTRRARLRARLAGGP
ncbi:MAG: hypothetical protein HY719_10550, partial [Planctomycetes bacterium]|nr:hypothetical protein [Planctomycetota bacterium]